MALLNYCMFDVSWHFVFFLIAWDFESLVEELKSAICPELDASCGAFLNANFHGHQVSWTGIGGVGVLVTRLIPLRDFGGASGFQYASKPPLPTSRSHLSRCHPRIRRSALQHASVLCNQMIPDPFESYLNISRIYIYSESDGGTQTQQNGFILRWNYFQKWHLQFDTRSCWIWESFLGILCFKWQSANITETHGASGKVTSWRPGVELGDMGCSTSLSLWCPISISVYIYI